MKILSFLLLYGFAVVLNSDKYNAYQQGNSVSKNGMEVSWKHESDRIRFEMSAPVTGWVTIGFNTTKGMAGCYLLMGRVKNEKVEVVEHYTQSPGEYYPISNKDVRSQLIILEGEEISNRTSISFSIPHRAQSKYQKNLFPNSEFVLVLAYSQEDDFQQHSIMRTSIPVKL